MYPEKIWLLTADALSRAPLPVTTQPEVLPGTAIFVNNIISSLPASEKRVEELKAHQQQDPVCQKIIKFCQEGWPDQANI